VIQGRSGKERVQQEEHWYGCPGVCGWGGGYLRMGTGPSAVPTLGLCSRKQKAPPLLVETCIVVDVEKQLSAK